MSSEAKKIFLAGLGTAALTFEKAGEVVNDLIAKGKLSVEEGKELSQELKRNITEKGTETKENVKQKIDDIKPITKESLKEVLGEMDYATKADVLELKAMIEKLEAKFTNDTQI
jgi:poly(hydroxyalkanoate) granule-associated protein